VDCAGLKRVGSSLEAEAGAPIFTSGFGNPTDL
jgi:hypothetical protein